jgi:predicted methyltransferase
MARAKNQLLVASVLAMLAALTFTSTSATAATPEANLQQAVAGKWRRDGNVKRDAWRKPAEALTFWGLKPGMTVLELSPGGGYWTEILAPYTRATSGRYLTTAPDSADESLPPQAHEWRKRFANRFADEAIFGRVELVNFGEKTTNLGPRESVDFVLNGRNFHNWIGDKTVDAILAQCFAVLRPGGILAIEEHRNAPDAKQDPEAKSGYVTEAYVIAAAKRAGFVLAARSEVFANPKDDRDHPFGVWTLPPTLAKGAYDGPQDPKFDSAPYAAIGESDRMALRFVKPGI